MAATGKWPYACMRIYEYMSQKVTQQCFHLPAFSKLGSISGRFGVGLGSIWGRFGVGLGSIWGRFGIDLGSVWDQFGVGLGSVWDRFWVG